MMMLIARFTGRGLSEEITLMQTYFVLFCLGLMITFIFDLSVKVDIETDL